MERLQPSQLLGRPFDQGAELEVRQVIGVRVLERPPQPALTDDADLQQLQLVEAA